MRRASSGGNPGPWSETQVVTPSSPAVTMTWMVPPIGPCCTALSIRLTSTWRKRLALPRAISESGAAYLAGNGNGAALVASKAFKQLDDPVVLHSLDINDVHLTLIRCGELVRWKSELEILCLNELTGFGYAKDYDAVITIHSDGEDSTFALEYERQPKAANRYWQVRQAIEKERQVRCFLYLAPSYELLSYVAGFFDRCAKAVYFGVLEDFCQHGLDAKVLDSRRTRSFPLRAVLNGNAP